MSAPSRDIAISLYNKSIEIRARDPQLSFKLMISACDSDPDFGEGWFSLGNATGDMKMLAASAASYRRALDIDPLDAVRWNSLGHRLYHMGRIKEATEAIERAIDLDPTLSYAWTNLSLIKSIRCRHVDAIAAARKAIELADEPVNRLGLAFALLFAERYAEGFAEFECRYAYKLTQFLDYPYRQWNGEPIHTLMIQSEQGMGDTIRFLRYMPLVMDRIDLAKMYVHPELVRLARDMLASYGDRIEVNGLPQPLPAADAWTTVGSLPTALGLTDEIIVNGPRLPSPEYEVPAPWKAPGRKIHIGIAWAGSPMNDIDRHRELGVERFLDLYKVEGVQLYSLQVGDRVTDLHAAGCAALIKDLSPYIRDVADTVGVLAHLDMVICVESALGHICGLAGKECWIPYSMMGGDWQLGRTESGLMKYPGHKVFRQSHDMSWDPVFDRIVSALEFKVGEM